jgi:peptide deformylase
VIVLDDDEQMLELVNPEVLEQSGEQTAPEGCLSVPGKWGMVTRPSYVKIRAQDRFGNWFEMEREGLTARCFCHEIEHLDGHLYVEHIDHFLSDEELEAYYEEHGEEAR